MNSQSLPETAEAVVNDALPESAGDQLQTPDSGPLKLAGELTIGTAEELHQRLAGFLDRGPGLVLDLSGVEVCDTAALQLIIALRKSAVQRKQQLHIAELSPAIQEFAAALGFDLDVLTRGGRD